MKARLSQGGGIPVRSYRCSPAWRQPSYSSNRAASGFSTEQAFSTGHYKTQAPRPGVSLTNKIPPSCLALAG